MRVSPFIRSRWFMLGWFGGVIVTRVSVVWGFWWALGVAAAGAVIVGIVSAELESRRNLREMAEQMSGRMRIRGRRRGSGR